MTVAYSNLELWGKIRGREIQVGVVVKQRVFKTRG